MQVKKKEIKDRIIKYAKLEFKENCFAKSSLRTIASRANVTKGNIYNYFQNKDELFLECTKNARSFMHDSLNKRDYVENIKNTHEVVVENKDDFERFYKEIENNREELILLFFRSQGSKLENYREDVIIPGYTNTMLDYVSTIDKLTQNNSTKVDILFCHTLAKVYISFIEEILLHNPSDKSIELYKNNMTTFVGAGFQRLVEGEK